MDMTAQHAQTNNKTGLTVNPTLPEMYVPTQTAEATVTTRHRHRHKGVLQHTAALKAATEVHRLTVNRTETTEAATMIPTVSQAEATAIQVPTASRAEVTATRAHTASQAEVTAIQAHTVSQAEATAAGANPHQAEATAVLPVLKIVQKVTEEDNEIKIKPD